MRISGTDYLITKGMVSLFENRFKLQLSTEAKAEIKLLEDNLIDEVMTGLHSLTQYNVRILKEEEINQSMAIMLQNENNPIINIDDVYFNNLDKTVFHYSSSRLVNPDNFNDYIQGPRAGYPSLEEQIQAIASKIDEAVWIDIGAFDGTTAVRDLFNFRANGVRISAVYLATISEFAVKYLNQDEIKIDVRRGGITDASLNKLQEQGEDILIEVLEKKDSDGNVVKDNLCLFVKNPFKKYGVELNFPQKHKYNIADWMESRDITGFGGKKPMKELNGKPIFSSIPTDYYLVIPVSEKSTWICKEDKEAHFLSRLISEYQDLFSQVLEKEGYTVNIKQVRINKTTKKVDNEEVNTTTNCIIIN